jgi:simple sugar transport system ATP-binding protein
VLVVSSELDEVVGLADRIAVMYRGRILAIVSPDTPREELGLLMAGITDGTAPAAAPVDDGAVAAAADLADEEPAAGDGAAEKGTK